jgi:hypothetical protein
MAIKVKFIGWGILVDDAGDKYVCDVDDYGTVESCETEKRYGITKRDEFDYPIEIEERATLMNNVIEILMKRDGLSKKEASALVLETRDMIYNCGGRFIEAEEIMMDQLGLEVD